MGARHVDTPAGQPPAVFHQGWPELVYSPAFLVYEDNQWYATLTRFNITGAGVSPAQAWREMDELAEDYFALCAAEGLPFNEVVRPMPRHRRLGLYARYFVGSLLRPFFREHRPREHEFVRIADLNGQQAAF